MSEIEEKQRTSAEIVVALEEKVDTILRVISVYDMNAKLTLDRVNKIYAYIEKLQAEDDLSQQPQSDIITTSQEHLIPIADTPSSRGRTSRVETFMPPPQDEKPTSPVPPQSAQPRSQDRKVPITQRVVDSNSKDVFYADITITNSNGEQVSKAKTNAVGKWQAHLKPGMYNVQIIKTDTATKKRHEMMQEINVPDVDTTVVLPQVSIKR